jgi:hypothetical protein
MSKLPMDIGSPRIDHHPVFGTHLADRHHGEPHPNNKEIQHGRHIDTLPTNAPKKEKKTNDNGR